jgi:hypothetical protein
VTWTFRTFVSGRGEEEVSGWYDAQSPKVQAAFDQRIRTLAQMRLQEWRDPYTKKLKGDGSGLIEIRFFADNVQHRPLGFFGPGRGEFTILICAIEQGDDFVPHDAIAIAQRRKREVLQDARSRIFSVD